LRAERRARRARRRRAARKARKARRNRRRRSGKKLTAAQKAARKAARAKKRAARAKRRAERRAARRRARKLRNKAKRLANRKKRTKAQKEKARAARAAKRAARAKKRAERAAKIAPRPVAGLLRPIVSCPTVRYNSKLRLGRGFTLDELAAAGINKRQALTIGVAVDYRRTNRSEEKFQENVQRLKKYRANLILFPRNSKKPKAGDSSADSISAATQFHGDLLPITRPTPEVKGAKVEQPKVSAFLRLRRARGDVKYIGRRAKRAKAAAEKKDLAIKRPPKDTPAAKGAAPAQKGKGMLGQVTSKRIC